MRGKRKSLPLFSWTTSKCNFRREAEKGQILSSREERFAEVEGAAVLRPCPDSNRSCFRSSEFPRGHSSTFSFHGWTARRARFLLVHRFPFFRIPIVFQKNFLQGSANRPNGNALELSPTRSILPSFFFLFFFFPFVFSETWFDPKGWKRGKITTISFLCNNTRDLSTWYSTSPLAIFYYSNLAFKLWQASRFPRKWNTSIALHLLKHGIFSKSIHSEKNYWNYSGNDTIFDRSNVACFLSLPFAKRDAKCLDNGERRRQEEDGVGCSIDRISMKSESMSAQYFTIKSDNHGPSHLCNIHRARYATDCVSSLEVPPQRLTSRSWKGDLHRRTSMRCPAMRKRIFY